MTETPQNPVDADQNAAEEAAYTAVIGDKVRTIRARRGIARKQLSSQSDISERYLAQIESGKANISIVLLHRLARAMMVPVTDFLPSTDQPNLPKPLMELLLRLEPEQHDEALSVLAKHFEPQRQQRSGIALIGLRGAGKSTLGHRLADAFALPFIRISDIVEELSGVKPSELIALGGQAVYRPLEREALEYVLSERPVAVVEAGGSLVSEPETFQRLLNNYYTVWLKASPEEHMQRVIQQGDTRPMQGNGRAMDDLKRILVEREVDYRKADYTLDTNARTIEECSKELYNISAPILHRAPASGPETAP